MTGRTGGVVVRLAESVKCHERRAWWCQWRAAVTGGAGGSLASRWRRGQCGWIRRTGMGGRRAQLCKLWTQAPAQWIHGVAGTTGGRECFHDAGCGDFDRVALPAKLMQKPSALTARAPQPAGPGAAARRRRDPPERWLRWTREPDAKGRSASGVAVRSAAGHR